MGVGKIAVSLQQKPILPVRTDREKDRHAKVLIVNDLLRYESDLSPLAQRVEFTIKKQTRIRTKGFVDGL
jgi:hypothetical protein